MKKERSKQQEYEFPMLRLASTLKEEASAWLRTIENPKTRKTHVSRLKKFFEFSLDEKKILFSPQHITEDLVHQYIYYLNTITIKKRKESGIGKLSSETRHNLMLTLRVFLKHLYHRRKITFNPSDLIKLKGRVKQKCRTRSMTEVEFAAVLTAAVALYKESPISDRFTHENAMRKLLCVHLLLTTGMRIGELVSLLKGSVQDCGTKVYLSYITKGSVYNQIVLAPESAHLLKEYLSLYRRDAKPEDPLLMSPFPGGRPLTPLFVNRHLAKVSKKAAIGWDITAHVCRVSIASLWHYSNTPLEAIQSALGHRTITTTIRYIKRAEMDRGTYTQVNLGERFGIDIPDVQSLKTIKPCEI